MTVRDVIMSAAGGTSTAATYVDDVFSTYLYTGNGYPTSGTQNITNGIDLSTKGGLVWVKARSVANHTLTDTARGTNSQIFSSATQAAETVTDCVTAFNTNGFSLGQNSQGTLPYTNVQNKNFVSWTFAKQAKFFDIVTYTGNGSFSRNISHSLASVPGCIIIKKTSSTGDWKTLARKNSTTYYTGLNLNTTDSAGSEELISDVSTSTTVDVGYLNAVVGATNDNGATYVAYLFAHDAGGFGAAGTDNVISCGSFTADGSGNASVNLGYEPQWLLAKASSSGSNWVIRDNIRGWTTSNANILLPNTSDSETTSTAVTLNSTGFNFSSSTNAGVTWIYIAIRRPHKPPTTGTEVFAVSTQTGDTTPDTITSGFPVDLSIDKSRQFNGSNWFVDRLRGGTKYIGSDLTNAEATYGSNLIDFDRSTSIINKNYGATTGTYVNWMFKRAPGFFDEVCYSGNGASGTSNSQTISHNLTVVPELAIFKQRNTTGNWAVWYPNAGSVDVANLNTSDASLQTGLATSSLLTATTFTARNFVSPAYANYQTNVSGSTYVAYLFATCAGISKVGSYTGNGSSQNINCGFTNGARFILLKRTSASGQNWYVWDTSRGITSGNDPFLLLSSSASEYTTYDYVAPYSSGFTVNSGISVSGENYVYFAIA